MPNYPPTVYKYPTTGAAAIGAASKALVPLGSGPRELISVTLHLSGDPGAVTLTITLNNVNGAAWDTLLKSQAMSGITDFVWRPTPGRMILQPGDALDFVMADPSKTWGLEVTMMEVR